MLGLIMKILEIPAIIHTIADTTTRHLFNPGNSSIKASKNEL